MNRRPLSFLILSSSAFFSFSHPLSRLPTLHLSHTLSHSSSTSTLLGLPVLHQTHPRPVRLCYTVKPPHPRRRPEVESTTAALFLELSTQSDPISSHKSFSNTMMMVSRYLRRALSSTARSECSGDASMASFTAHNQLEEFFKADRNPDEETPVVYVKAMEELRDDIKTHLGLDRETPTHIQYWEEQW